MLPAPFIPLIIFCSTTDIRDFFSPANEPFTSGKMVDKDPIVISDSDSDTLSESERPTQQQQKAVSAKTKAILQPEAPATRTSTSSDTLTEPPSRDDTSRPTPDAGSSSTASSLLSLLPDRRQLELERQERARKRRREQGLLSESSDEGEGKEAGSKRIGIGSGYIDPRQPQQASSSLSSAIQQDVKLTAPHASSSKHTLDGSPSPKFSRARDPIHPSSRFFDGTIKHGYNRYSSSGVSIPQMLLPATASSRNGLQLAVLATYDLRLDWLYSLFPRGLPVTLVLPPPKEDYRTDPAIARPGLHRSEIFGGDFARCPGWQICVPHKPKGGWLTQHMKFLLLVHEGWMRVAILSGNLNEIDWERIENTAYIQDFPLLPSATAGKSSDRAEGNDFKNQLIRVLRSLSMPPSHPIFAAMEKHDFSKATRARIVASWPEASSLEGWDRIETQGLGRLGKVVRELGVGASVELECQGSSLANHDVKWIEHFHLLASGVSPRGLLPLKGKPNERHAEYFRATGRKVGSLPPVKICFPSQRYVEQDTVEGGMGALSFFGKAETFGKSP